ncbi:UNVERIFIED_CONTAM: hypothetical protein FKN15_010830 [Acipenser sinensis]
MDWPLLVARVLLATTVRAARIHPGQCITPAPRDTSALRSVKSITLPWSAAKQLCPCLPGYYCQGGAVDAVPQGSAVFPKNGPCPLGHYCPAATLTPVPCPLGSIKNTTGGSSLASCLPCPAGHYCASEGLSMPSGHCSAGFYCPSAFTSISPNAFLCPKGHHCPPGSAHAHPCPTGEYQPNPGSDYCIPCRPGFYCEEAIAGDPRPCPPHTYCPAATQVPQLCPNGTFTLADMSGLQEERECLPCPSGKFCRGGKIQGSCAAGFLCLSGSSEFTPRGSDLENRTSCLTDYVHHPCPPGFWCPGSGSPVLCPAGTMRTEPGSTAVSHCDPCTAGFYCPDPMVTGQPNIHGIPCRASSECPPGTEHYMSNSCPIGYYCPAGTALAVPCPPGSYGNSTQAKHRGECYPCPADTFNHLFGQKACFPCGSSSFSLPGAASCICRGLNRAFQQSDGSCICRAGYVYYNELDQKRSTGNSDMDCQSEVNERCGPGEVRLASTRECVLPGGYDCTAACGSQGGNLSVELGICHCAEYVSAEELCNASCLSKMPKITASLGPNGQLVLNIKDREARGTRDKHVVDTLGPEQYSPAGGSVHIVQFAPEGVFGLIVKERRLLDVFLSGESTSPEVTETPNTLSRNRRSSEHAAAAARIPNPIACLKPSDMIIFQLSLNHRNRSLSHFPVYQKDHLFNSNPGWDSGAFRRLGHLVKETRFNFSRFAHVFSEPGKYVLLDNAAQERSLVVVVSEHHTECESRSFQPSSPGHLVRHGVLKQRQLNLVPNWGAIAAGSCCSVCVEVPSDNLAVQGTNMKLACISCMKREEVSAETEVEWFYTSPEGENITMCSYYNGVQREVCPYKDRLIWNGSKDFQDVSVSLINVTLNDTGRYTCRIRRYLNFEIHSHTTKDEKYIDLLVTEEAGEDFTAVISEIMMYVLLVFLTLWLLIEMVYCYIKISRADEVVQDNAESVGSLEQGKTPEPPEPIQGRCTALHTL